MTYTISNLTRTDMASFDNNAAACYNRIIPNLMNLRSKQLGVPEKISNMLAKLLQEFEYKVKTSYGVSESTYRNTPNQQIFGIGQGGRASSTAWLITSIMLIDIMKTKTQGIQFTNPTQTQHVQRIMDAFKDDCTK